MFGAIWFVIGSVLQASAFQFAQLVVGRFIGGIGIGILSSTAPMYISEIAPPNVRGALLVFESNLIVLGVIIMFYIVRWPVFSIGLTLSTDICHTPYRQRLVVPAAVHRSDGSLHCSNWHSLGAALLASLARIEGPDMEALDSLCRLRNLPQTDPRVQAEWLTIRAEAIRNREVVVEAHPNKTGLSLEVATWGDMFKPALIRKTMIGIMLMLFQQFVGINAVSVQIASPPKVPHLHAGHPRITPRHCHVHTHN